MIAAVIALLARLGWAYRVDAPGIRRAAAWIIRGGWREERTVSYGVTLTRWRHALSRSPAGYRRITALLPDTWVLGRRPWRAADGHGIGRVAPVNTFYTDGGRPPTGWPKL